MSFRAPDAALLSTAIFVVAGIAFGWGYFAALRCAVTLYCAGSGRLRATGLSLGRLAAAAGFFLLAARAGVWPLLGALLAFLVTRAFAVRSARRIA